MLGCLLLASMLQGAPSRDEVVITPPVVVISPDRPFADVRVRNLADAPLEIQAVALAWTQDERARVTLAPTDAVSMYPTRVELPPGDERKLRLTVVERRPVRSGAYRVCLQLRELPTGEEVTALIPAFVVAEPPVESAAVHVDCPARDRCHVVLENTGNVQLRPTRVIFEVGAGAGAGPTSQVDLEAWWVLPGGSRVYDVALAPAAGAREVLVRVSVNGVELTASNTLSP
ncbi:MAG TPA: hypothetical protein VF875_08430 [Anaeromyxobacter sp.]